MLSRARTMFRKLRGRDRRSSRGNEPTPSAPATIAKSKHVGPPPRAIHFSKWRPPLTDPSRKIRADKQEITILVANAKGAGNDLDFYELAKIEETGYMIDPTDDYTLEYVCDDCRYDVTFSQPLTVCIAMLSMMQHVCLVFTYDASSKESWEEMATACQSMRSHCEDGVLPFLATMIAAIGEDETVVSHAEAEAFATQQKFLFGKFSPRNRRGLSDAVCSLVELAHGVRDQYSRGPRDADWSYERAKTITELTSSWGSLAQKNSHQG